MDATEESGGFGGSGVEDGWGVELGGGVDGLVIGGFGVDVEGSFDEQWPEDHSSIIELSNEGHV